MTPLVVYVVEPSEGVTKNVMFYGHLDKQPYGEGWETNPTDPVIKGDFMYGRGIIPIYNLLSYLIYAYKGPPMTDTAYFRVKIAIYIIIIM